MKLVITRNGETISEDIREYRLFELVESLRSYRIKTKSPYELLRYRTEEELIIIYQNNRRFRSRNGWIEKRAITALAQKIHDLAPIERNVKMVMNGVETEVDGVAIDGTLIEVKNTSIADKDLKFYESKRRKLAPDKNLILIGRKFTLQKYHQQEFPLIKCMVFEPDGKTLRNYYLKSFSFPQVVDHNISRRHVRFLLSNGRWIAQRSRYTQTAKWTITEKFQRDIRHIHRKLPTKIYWSLAEMTGPLDEFRGKGYPVDRLLTAFDVDGSHEGNHRIIDNAVCQQCKQDAKLKLEIVTESLNELGILSNYRVYSSGSKGYHIYIMDDTNNFNIVGQQEMERLINQFIPYVDSFLSKHLGEFDMHRIFKIPHTVDASTGVLVKQDHEVLQFEDILENSFS